MLSLMPLRLFRTRSSQRRADPKLPPRRRTQIGTFRSTTTQRLLPNVRTFYIKSLPVLSKYDIDVFYYQFLSYLSQGTRSGRRDIRVLKYQYYVSFNCKLYIFLYSALNKIRKIANFLIFYANYKFNCNIYFSVYLTMYYCSWTGWREDQHDAQRRQEA